MEAIEADLKKISIHAPAKGATSSLHETPFEVQFQSTLPRRERRIVAFPIDAPYTISIHAPAKGATVTRMELRPYQQISIHAPAKGAT